MTGKQPDEPSRIQKQKKNKETLVISFGILNQE